MVDIRSSEGQTVYVEGRWVAEEGKLRKVHVSDYGDSTVIDRFEPSDRYPTYISGSGPTFVTIVKATGKINSLKYVDSAGVEKTVSPLLGNTNAEIIARYNTTTGQNWDGYLPSLDGYDLSAPFMPQG